VNSSQPAGARWILTSVVLAAGIVFLDTTIVNVALARIGEDLPATLIGTLEGQAYVTSGYLAVLSALLILAGAMSDRYGRRRIFAIGLVAFGVTSVLCGLAPTLEALIVGRFFQGAAGALLVPGALTIITTSFQGAARARAFGIWAAATSALTVLGPLAGGILVDTLSWRIAFLVNAPLVLVALYGALRHVPETRDEQAPRRLDWLGSLVIIAAVGGISFGLIRGEETRWTAPEAFVSLGLGIVAAVLFPILMLRRTDPLVPPALFRIRDFVIINGSTFLIYGALYVTATLQYLFLQGVLGYTALGAALVALPTGLLLSLGSTRVGSLAGRIGPWRFLVAGPLLMAAGQLWLARIPGDSAPWLALADQPASLLPPVSTIVDVLPASILFGLGIMLVVAPLTSALMGSVPSRNAGLGSAINNAISRVGQPLLLALLFVAITATFYSSLEALEPALDTGSPAVREAIQPLNEPGSDVPDGLADSITAASTDAFHVAMLATAVLLLGGAAVNSLGLRRHRRERAVTDADGGRGIEVAEGRG
jgi:EmrB/QacA subfamily drug resistance transporter